MCVGFPGSSDGKASAYNAGDLGSIPGLEDPLEKEMATLSSILAWKIPWTEDHGGLQSMGSQSQTRLSDFTFTFMCIELCLLSSVLQMPNDCRMVSVEFFGSFSCSFKRISFDDSFSWSLSTSDGRPLCSSSSRLSSPLQNFLNHTALYVH